MIDDANMFSDGQDPAVAAAGNIISTRVLSRLAADNLTTNLGAGKPVYLVVQVETAITHQANATLQITLESDSAAALNVAPTVHLDSGAIDLTAVPANAALGFQWFAVALPSGDYQEFIGLRFAAGVADVTGGGIDAFLVDTLETWQPYVTRSVNNA